jgi:hypothetical protein
VLVQTFRAAIVATLIAIPCHAQTPVTLAIDSVFFGDNTEFFGPFRDGETILGASQRLFADIEASDRATLRVGLYLMQQAGSASPVERALPIVSLFLGTLRQRFILGTLDTGKRVAGIGPDATTPHGLLPPLAVEPRWFTRAYEAGVQWVTKTRRFEQDSWFDYQKMNTPAHRELFDAGGVGRLRGSSLVSLVYQWHVVHHGGQQSDTGPVSDSVGYGPGVVVDGRLPGIDNASIEAYTLFAYDRPDREDPTQTVLGRALFVRAAARLNLWRAHVIVWRGDDFNHEDGDPNYLSRYPDGARYRGTRDYSEAGLARLFKPAPTIEFEASGRLHLIERRRAYSYRLLATIHLDLWRTLIGK